eukprot:1158047-Pelagomonas_calceolata.AAC.3
MVRRGTAFAPMQASRLHSTWFQSSARTAGFDSVDEVASRVYCAGPVRSHACCLTHGMNRRKKKKWFGMVEP